MIVNNTSHVNNSFIRQVNRKARRTGEAQVRKMRKKIKAAVRHAQKRQEGAPSDEKEAT